MLMKTLGFFVSYQLIQHANAKYDLKLDNDILKKYIFVYYFYY